MRFSGAVIGSALLAAAHSSASSVSVPTAAAAAEGAPCTATVLALPEVHLGPTSTVFPSTSTAIRAVDCGGCAAVATSDIHVGVLPVVDYTATVTADAPATVTSFTCAEAGLPTPAVQPDGPLKFLVPVPVADTPAGTFGKLKALEVRKLEGYWVGGAGGKSAQAPASPQYGGHSPSSPYGSGPIAPSPGSPAGSEPLAPGPNSPAGSEPLAPGPNAPTRSGPLAPAAPSMPIPLSRSSPSAPTGFTTHTSARPEHADKHHKPKLPHAMRPHANSNSTTTLISNSNATYPTATATTSQAIWSAPPATIHTISPLGAQHPPTCTRSLTLAPALPRSTLTVYPSTVTHTSPWDCGGCAIVYSTLRITPSTPVVYVKTKTARKPSVVTELMCTDTPRAPRPTTAAAAYYAPKARAAQMLARDNDQVDLVDEVELEHLQALGYTFF